MSEPERSECTLTPNLSKSVLVRSCGALLLLSSARYTATRKSSVAMPILCALFGNTKLTPFTHSDPIGRPCSPDDASAGARRGAVGPHTREVMSALMTISGAAYAVESLYVDRAHGNDHSL